MADLTIVKNGKSPYCILINPKNPGAAKAAASDLQEYIEKATGAKLPIVKNSERNNRPAFLIGFETVDKPEGFRIKTIGKDIHISGDDTAGDVYNAHWHSGARVGTWYGVCDFLEKQLGVRWFMPGKLGEYVPKHTGKWSIPKLDYEDSPRMESRRMTMYYGKNKQQEREIFIWKRRNRSGNAESWCAWHTWLNDIPAKKYFDQHPEWFALINGRRTANDPMGLGVKICTTNPEVLDEFAKILINRAKSWKRPGMLSLGPNDGGNYCECKKCTALDDGFRIDGSPIITTRMMTYANEVAKRVLKELPNQKFGIYAYAYYAEALSKVKVNPAITIMEVKNDTGVSYYKKSNRDAHLKNLKA